jgi:hypothetical protein|tara:strand:- start:1799 stop:2134 length:336 start_codon:yes stop_codon:yes gene_type:complete
MEGQIVDIEYEDEICEIARIVFEVGDDYAVQVLDYDRRGLYIFSDDTLLVPKDSVSGFYDTTLLEETGLYTKYDTIHYEMVDESDPDVIYDSSDESDSDSEVSLCDEEGLE